VGGLFVAQKGRSYKKEIDKALKAVQLLGGELSGVENVTIPFINQERYLLVIKKIKYTPLKYPRKEGLPQKRPL
jgi:16S rRNA (guanine527-N7)-methyltransferase